MDNINVKQKRMKAIDWQITGSIFKDKYNLKITYANNTTEVITDTLTELTKIIKTI